jgi:tight adherence protein B
LNTTGLLIGGLFLLILAFLLIRALRRGGGLDERLVAYAALPELERRGGTRRRAWLVRLRLWLNRTLSFLSSEETAVQLQSANWPVTVTEYVLARFGVTLAALALVSLVTQNLFVGIGVATILYISPGFWLRMSINQRRRKFEKQLVDILVLITGAVKAGFSLLQAFEVVMHEITPPGSEELKRVLQEVSLGRALSAALANMAQRMENKDLNLLITAINIQYQVGGNLTTMLSAVTETIRERIRLYSELRALTSQQRLSSYIISLLPVIVMAVLFIINPDYMRGLFNREYWFIPAIAAFGIITGAIIIQRLVKMDF